MCVLFCCLVSLLLLTIFISLMNYIIVKQERAVPLGDGTDSTSAMGDTQGSKCAPFLYRFVPFTPVSVSNSSVSRANHLHRS